MHMCLVGSFAACSKNFTNSLLTFSMPRLFSVPFFSHLRSCEHELGTSGQFQAGIKTVSQFVHVHARLFISTSYSFVEMVVNLWRACARVVYCVSVTTLAATYLIYNIMLAPFSMFELKTPCLIVLANCISLLRFLMNSRWTAIFKQYVGLVIGLT